MVYDHYPDLFALGPWRLGTLPEAGLRWYTVAYAVGFCLAWRALRRAAGQVPGVCAEDIVPLTAVLIGAILVGARVGEVALHQPRMLFSLVGWRAILNPARAGMNFFGALLALGVALAIFARRRGFDLWTLTDRLVIPFTTALALGRLANWFTGQQYGTPTNGSWGVRFQVEPRHLVDGVNVPRHPAQLYAAATALLLVLVLIWLSRRASNSGAYRPGRLTATFLVGHGLLRLGTECFRQEDLRWGPLTCGQALCLSLVVAGCLLALAVARRDVAGHREPDG